MNIDTNVDNYNLEDMVTLFKISKNLTPENVLQMNQTIHKLNFSYSDNEIDQKIHILFKKVFIILSCLYKYRDYLKIKITNYKCNNLDDYKLINFIKNLHDYENTNDINYLLNQMIENNQNNENNQNIENNQNNQIEALPDIKIKRDYYDVSNTNSELLPRPVILDNKDHKIMNIFENKIVSGDINSIKRITKLINVHIDSCFRDKYYNTNPCNFIYSLPKQFKNVVSMKLASIEIPNSWYLFSHLKKNNAFIIELTICDKCSIYNIVIPDGNYTNDNIVSFLNMKYFYQSNNDNPLKFIKFSIIEHSNRSQFEIVEGTPDDFIFSLHFTTEQTENILETFGWILGFRLAKYLKIEDYLLSEGLFDGGGDRYIYLTVNDYQYNYNETNIICFDKSSIEEHTLAKIPLINGKLSLIIDENNKNPLIKIRQYNGPVNLSKFEIKILDKYGNIIDLNFMDFSFSVELEVLYERNNII